MPEGHTVHRLARAFGALFTGQRLEVTSPQGRFAPGAALLDGRPLVAAEAWGKQLFLGFAADDDGADGDAASPGVRWLRVHLGLYGAWTFAGDGTAAVVHAIGAPRRRIGERETVPAAPPAALDGPAVPGDAKAAGDAAAGAGADAAATADGAGEWEPPAPRGAVRVRLRGPHAVADLTGPTACEVVTPEQKAAVEARLGPDPIRPDGGRASLDAAREDFVARVRRSRVVVGQQLMDQAVVAGVGNIYRAEALYRARLDPVRPGRDVDAGTLRGIWDDLVVLMRDGADHGAIVTTRPEHRDAGDGGTGNGGPDVGGQSAPRRRTRQNTDGAAGAVPAEDAFYVYHRDGLPCRVCGTPVLVKELAGRNLFWCPACQV
ncbi:Fpg/Nei family DNA glycosylase [Puerhibacterium sp. TATVAM-FAB25]|uniref:Fpg/Nei family DNA glycosylase n=1 Tax=Puerhibacterium sp. TATVAM-FAB25 TaxID=3093699 RepID=UPI00397E2D31